MLPPHPRVHLTKVHYYESFRKGRNIEIPTISREVSDNYYNKNRIIKKNVFGHTWVLKINDAVVDDGHKRTKRKKFSCSTKTKLFIYIFGVIAIVIAICTGVYFTVIENFSTSDNNTTKNVIWTTQINQTFYNGKTKHTYFSYRPAEDTNRIEPILNKLDNTLETSTIRTTTRKNVFNTYFYYNTMRQQQQQQEEQRNTASWKHSVCNCSQTEVCLKLRTFSLPACVIAADVSDPSGCGGHCSVGWQFCRKLDRRVGLHECANLTNLLQCPAEYFSCGDTCIPNVHLCDGTIHCADKRDELNCDCDLSRNFHCGNNTSCVPNEKKCDKMIDCWDKSDEVDCEYFHEKTDVDYVINKEIFS